MKNLKLILLLQALMLGALTVNADDDCCPDGSDPSYECEDGSIVCDASECPPCSTDNPYPSSSDYICCGGQEYLAADYCCDDSDNPVYKHASQPTISGPSNGSNMVNKTLGVPAPQFAVAFVGTTPLTPWDCGEATNIYEKTIIEPTDHVINDITKENEWNSSGTSGDAGACGIELNMTVQTGAPVSVTVGGGLSIPPFSFSVSSSIQIQAATSVNCNASAENHRWHYYEIFEHRAKLSGGTRVITYTKKYERQYRGCQNQTQWAPHGQPQPGLTVSANANLSTSWANTNTEYCATNSNECCP